MKCFTVSNTGISQKTLKMSETVIKHGLECLIYPVPSQKT